MLGLYILHKQTKISQFFLKRSREKGSADFQRGPILLRWEGTKLQKGYHILLEYSYRIFHHCGKVAVVFHYSIPTKVEGKWLSHSPFLIMTLIFLTFSRKMHTKDSLKDEKWSAIIKKRSAKIISQVKLNVMDWPTGEKAQKIMHHREFFLFFP